MPRLSWSAQNEETDADGFFLSDAAFLAAERRWLEAEGAPSLSSLVWVGLPSVVDRDEAVVTADVDNRLGRWLRDEIDATDADE